MTCTAAKQDGVVGMYGGSDAIAKLFSCSSGDVSVLTCKVPEYVS